MWGKSDLFSPLFFQLLTPSENAKKNRYISSVLMSLELKIHTKNMNTHIYTRTDFQEHSERVTEDMRARMITKTLLFFLFFCLYFFPSERRKTHKCSLQKAHEMTERKSSRKTLTPKRFIPEEEKKEKELSGGQKSGGSKVRLIS